MLQYFYHVRKTRKTIIMPEKFKKRLIANLIISMLALTIFIIALEGKFVSKKTLSQKNYDTKINLSILKDGSLHVEQNIKVNSSYYSTYFFSDLPSRFNEYDYDENVKNLKVYYNDNLLIPIKSPNGYFNYRSCSSITSKIIDAKDVERGFSTAKFNNIEIFMPQNYGTLKIVYDLENYIVNYTDINYLEYDFKYGYNLFDDNVQINISMPEFTDKFLINTNLEFNHSSLTQSLNNTTKQISITGLKNNPLHMEVLFDRQISESNLKFNQDNYKYLSNKFKRERKKQIELYVVMFLLLNFVAFIVTCTYLIRWEGRAIRHYK